MNATVRTAGEDFDLALTQSTPGLTSVDRTETGTTSLKFKQVLVSSLLRSFHDKSFQDSLPNHLSTLPVSAQLSVTCLRSKLVGQPITKAQIAIPM